MIRALLLLCLLLPLAAPVRACPDDGTFYWLTYAEHTFTKPDSVSCNYFNEGTRLRLTNPANGKSTVVVVRSMLARIGPFVDADPATWLALGVKDWKRRGKITVCVQEVKP